MNPRYRYFSIILLATYAHLLLSCTQGGDAVIRITENMVINEVGSGDHMAWFDEQDPDGIPQTSWKTHGLATYWPAGVVIDLGTDHRISEVWVFDGEKTSTMEGGQLRLAIGSPFNWVHAQDIEMNNGGQWIKVGVNRITRYLQLQKHATKQYNLDDEYPKNQDVAICEVLVKGGAVARMPRSSGAGIAHAIPAPVAMDAFIGMNSYIHTPDRVHGAVGNVREYRPWRWNGVLDLEKPIDWGDITDKGPRKGGVARAIGNSDAYYAKMKQLGIECIPCVHRHVDEQNHKESIPHFGGHPDDPFSYRMISDYSFQFVARYGHTPVVESLLRTTEPSPKRSGMGLIRYFENWNEPNGWWGMPAEHFTPYQFAAFCSASYDGHLNRMGSGFGVKNADPSIKYVFGGLAELSLSYVQAMKLWSDHHRNGSFPADVINLHHYCNTMGKQHAEEEAYGISPEQDGLKEKLEKIVEWRNRHLPDKELWLSEFGWDTHEGSYQSAAFGHERYPEGINMDEIQGQWLTRAYLIGAAAGLDRMMMYLANDIRHYPHKVFGWCGFITVDEEYKPSWYYVNTLRRSLTGMVFHDEYPAGRDDVWIYRFRNPASDAAAYVLWCPTSNGTEVVDYALKLTGSAGQATEVRLQNKEESGERKALHVSQGTVRLTVSERPTIVLVNNL